MEKDGEAARQRGDRARLFLSYSNVANRRWSAAALCGLWRGREGGEEEGGQYRHLSLSEAGVPYRSWCILEIMW